AHVQAGNLQQAKVEVKEATTHDPNLIDAELLQAELQIQGGAHQAAVEALEKLVAKQPGDVRAYILLGSAYFAKRELVKATEAYRKVMTLTPSDPQGPYLVGVALRAQGKSVEAKREFEAALSLAPGYVEPLAQLVAMAFVEKQRDAGLDRVKKQIALAPKTAGLYELLRTVHQVPDESGPAEAAYPKALQLAPRLMGPSFRLSGGFAALRH